MSQVGIWSTLTLATWNLRRPAAQPNARSTTIRRHIDRVAADVWVLTETHDSMTPGDGYAAVSTTVADRVHRPGERWVTIWSRWPIERLGTTADPMRAVAVRVIVGAAGAAPSGEEATLSEHRSPTGSSSPAATGERGLIVYGTVLPWVGSEWCDIPWRDGAFAAALEAQSADWRALRVAYPDDGLFVLGDLNQDLVNRPPHYYGSATNRRLLLDALDGAGLVAVTGGDGDPVRRGAGPEMQGAACIDHICIPEAAASAPTSTASSGRAAASAAAQWRAGTAWRWPEGTRADLRGVSDHFGVAVEITEGGGR